MEALPSPNPNPNRRPTLTNPNPNSYRSNRSLLTFFNCENNYFNFLFDWLEEKNSAHRDRQIMGHHPQVK